MAHTKAAPTIRMATAAEAEAEAATITRAATVAEAEAEATITGMGADTTSKEVEDKPRETDALRTGTGAQMTVILARSIRSHTISGETEKQAGMTGETATATCSPASSTPVNAFRC